MNININIIPFVWFSWQSYNPVLQGLPIARASAVKYGGADATGMPTVSPSSAASFTAIDGDDQELRFTLTALQTDQNPSGFIILCY